MGNNITKPNPIISSYQQMNPWNNSAAVMDEIWFNLFNHQSIDMTDWPTSIYFLNEPFAQDILFTAYVTCIWTAMFLGWFLWDLWNQTKFAAEWPEQTLGGKKAEE